MSADTRNLEAARARVAAVYDPNRWQEVGEKLIGVLAEHFRRVQSGNAKVLPWAAPEELLRVARDELDVASGDVADVADVADRIAELVRKSLTRGINLHHPRYMGHQVPASVPLAALFDLAGSATNQVLAIYEMGPWATAIERVLVAAIGERIGFAPDTFAGLVTSGGSLANLTALLTARNVKLGDAWAKGLAGRSPAPVLVVHADAHYSVIRAAGLLGIGTEQVVQIGLDRRRRMDPEQLQDAVVRLRKAGVPIIAVAAAACATPIGAFDPLEEIADVCHSNDVWLHVDAAHGGACCFSEQHRHLLAGIEQADSVVCDAHKMMFMPALCAMVFYRSREHRYSAFHQDAPYLFDPSAPELAEFDSGLMNLECTKRAAAFGLWGVWSVFGPDLFGELVDVTFALAKRFYEQLAAAEDFEIPHEPECNIVAFRYLPPSVRSMSSEEQNAFQLRLRRHVIESGDAYLVASRIGNRSYLRTTIINPLTTENDLQALLETIRRHATAIM